MNLNKTSLKLFKMLLLTLPLFDKYFDLTHFHRLCIKPGTQKRNAGNVGNGGNVIFREILPNIPGKVEKHSGEFLQTFW